MTSLVNHSVTNLINGVSQQATSVRLDNQFEEQINCYSDVTKGLTIRNGLELLNIVDTDLSSRIPIEFTVDGEKYLLGLDIDSTGTELVHVPLSADVTALAASITSPEYFRGASREDIRIVEDKDRVYILNKKKKAGTNESNYTYFNVVLKSNSTGLPATDWDTGSYKLTITSVIDPLSSSSVSESPVDIVVTSSMGPTDIANAINATSIINETGLVSASGSKGNYRLLFSNIPIDFLAPTIVFTEISTISGSTTSTQYEPDDTFAYPEYVTGSFAYGTPFNIHVTTYLPTGQVNSFVTWTVGYVFSASGDQKVLSDGTWTYYRGPLQSTSSDGTYSVSTYAVRRERSITETDNYTGEVSAPTTETGLASSEDKFADKGMIWVTGVSANQSYDVTINYEDIAGVPYQFSISTVNVGTTASNIKLNWVAEQIRSAIDASTPFSSSSSDIYNNAVYFYSTNSGQYKITSIKVENNFDTTSINAIVRATIDNSNGITKIDNLPPAFVDGFKLRVGNEQTTGSNYYLVYDSTFQGWKETGLDASRALDKTSMPYIIDKEKIRTDNAIVLEPNTWKAASAGDRESNKSPSFVGRFINDIFLYGSRLGVATDDTIVMSSIDKPNEFFRTTTSTTLESNRVDIKLDASKIGFSPISHVISYNGRLIVNTTGSTQAELLVNSSFDLTKARLSEVSSYTLGDFKPLAVNNGLYFALSVQGKTNIYNYVTADGTTYEAQDITKHIPNYILGNVRNMDYGNNVFVLQTDYSKNILYIQNRYSSQGKMLQNAWHRWTLPYDVEYFYFQGNSLYILMTAVDKSSNTKTFVCQFDLNPQVVTENISGAYIGWKPFLDCYTRDKTLIENFDGFIGINDKYGTRFDTVTDAYDSTLVNQDTLGAQDGPYYSDVSPVYYWKIDGNTNTIVFNDGTPIISGNSTIISFDSGGYRYTRGDPVSGAAGYYKVSRQLITSSSFYSDDILYGIPFTAAVEFSEIVPRRQASDGTYTVMNFATLMIRRMRLNLGNSGVFSVTVNFKDRKDYVIKYTGQPLGKIQLGRNSASNINFKFPINGKSDRFSITVSTDTSQPFNLLSAEWQGKVTQKGTNI